jgi:hypothetical protein
VDVFNICSLLQISQACDAQQLFALCLHQIQVTLAFVVQTPEWQELSPELKEQVMQRR